LQRLRGGIVSTNLDPNASRTLEHRMAHGTRKQGTRPSHGAQLFRRKMYLSAGPGRGAKKQIIEIDRAETPHLVRGAPAPGLPYTDAHSINRRSTGLQALRLAPRRGHERIELSRKKRQP
jgi:hypothetical protein